MASSDATPFPIKNQAYRVTFPILDADGDLVPGATALDSEVSKDAGTFADCTNEATEIATSSGVYYLDLTSTEMNADTVAIIVKTSTSGAKTTTIVLYPITNGLDIPVDVRYVGGTAQTAGDLAARLPASLVSGRMDASVGAYQTGLTPLQPTTAGRTLDVTATGEAGIDWANIGSPNTSVNLSGTTIATTQAVASVTGNVGGNVAGSVGSVATGGISSASFAAGAINAAAIAADAIGASELAADAIAEIAAGVWDLLLSGHTTAGTMGAALNAAGSAGDPWTTALPGAYSAGSAGYIIGTNINFVLSTIAAYIDTEVAAIKAKTDNLPADPADASDIAASFSSIANTLSTIAAYIDTEVAAIKAKTDQLTFTKANEADVNIQSVNGVTVNGTGATGDEWGP